MKKVKISIIITIIIIVILRFILLLVLNTYSNDFESYEYKEETAPIVYSNTNFISIESVNSRENIELYINRLLTFINEENKIGAYSLLYSEYIKNNNITEENVFNNLYKISKEYSLELSEALVSQSLENFVYIIKGNIQSATEIGKSTNQEIYILLINNSTSFKIMPMEEEMYNKIKNGQIDITKYQNAKLDITNYNNSTIVVINNRNIMKKYIEKYRFNLLYNPNKAYYLLEENYRKSMYGTLDKFKSNISKIINDIQNLSITNVDTEYIDGMKIYYGKTQDKTYVVKEISLYEYNISIK